MTALTEAQASDIIRQTEWKVALTAFKVEWQIAYLADLIRCVIRYERKTMEKRLL